MKFANFSYEDFVPSNAETDPIANGYNIGDYIQIVAIDNLYNYMKIDSRSIVRIRPCDLATYDGEEVILPINFLMFNNSPYFFDKEGINFSTRIIPVFLGVTFWNFRLSEKTINYLKRYEPIGCRDEACLNYLKSHDITAYLNGCISVTLERKIKKDKNCLDKVFFIDVPFSLKKFIPKEIKDNIIFISSIFYKNEVVNNSILDVVNKRYFYIQKAAKLVVTSRLHIATTCIAWGIPVILVPEQVDHRYAWLEKYIPIYSEKEYEKIDWNPYSLNIEKIKKDILDNASNQLFYTYRKYVGKDIVNNFYLDREKHEIEERNKFEYDFKGWNCKEKIKYAIWGCNDIAEKLYKYINMNYPNAVLVKVFDSYRNFNFHGIASSKPEELKENDDFITFITSRRVCTVAKKYFEMNAKNKNAYIMVTKALIFLNEENIRENCN